VLVLNADGTITDSTVDPFAGQPVDFFISMQNTAPSAAPQETPVSTMPSDMGAPVPGLQADAPYTPADQVLVAGGGETPLTADVPYNISDTSAPTGFNTSAPGALKDAGGVGEWITNGFKSLANGFLSTMTQQPNRATASNTGGSFGVPGPGFLGRYGTATAAIPASTTSTSGSSIPSLVWLVALGALLILVLGLRVGR
jgi:hypothetical protein